MRSLRAFAGSGGKPFITRLGAISLLLALSGQARAATASFSTNPPVLGSVIISNLTGAFLTGHGPNDAPDSNVNDPRYVADDQPVQGQTFTTGSNTNGYKLTA